MNIVSNQTSGDLMPTMQYYENLSQGNTLNKPAIRAKGDSFTTLCPLTGFLFLFCLICCLFLQPLTAEALGTDHFAVIYPEVPSPYKAVFKSILDGIKSQNPDDYQFYPLFKSQNLEALRSQLETAHTTGIIALGKRGYLAAKKMKMPLPTIIGALPLTPNGISGISLSADPEQLFAKLKSLVPETKNIFVVYSPKTNGWLIPYAEKAAKENNLHLEAYAAKDLRETMRHYQQILQKARSRDTTIWLLLDKLTSNDDIVLPMLLQEAWDKDLIILSSKPKHVQRGALFSMYPDNFGLGQDLAQTIKKQKEIGKTGVVPLKRLHLAVNMRTAAHLGINFSSSQQQSFNLTFPSR